MKDEKHQQKAEPSCLKIESTDLFKTYFCESPI